MRKKQHFLIAIIMGFFGFYEAKCFIPLQFDGGVGGASPSSFTLTKGACHKFLYEFKLEHAPFLICCRSIDIFKKELESHLNFRIWRFEFGAPLGENFIGSLCLWQLRQTTFCVFRCPRGNCANIRGPTGEKNKKMWRRLYFFLFVYVCLGLYVVVTSHGHEKGSNSHQN